jgi:hypothetical protein
MIVITTVKRLKKLCRDYYDRGVARGYDLRCRMEKMERTRRGFITGSEAGGQLKEILREKGVESE